MELSTTQRTDHPVFQTNQQVHSYYHHLPDNCYSEIYEHIPLYGFGPKAYHWRISLVTSLLLPDCYSCWQQGKEKMEYNLHPTTQNPAAVTDIASQLVNSQNHRAARVGRDLPALSLPWAGWPSRPGQPDPLHQTWKTTQFWRGFSPSLWNLSF